MMNKHTAKKTRLGKSIPAGVLSVALAMSASLSFAEEIESREISDGYVTIEGELIRESEGATVTLLVTDSDIDFTDETDWLAATGNEVSYYNEFTLGDDKAYSFKFKLSDPGTYNVYLASKTEGIEKSQIIYVDEKKSDEIIQAALDAEDASALKSAVENNLADLGVFGVEASDFDENAAEILFAEISGKESIESNEMILLTEKAILISKINSGDLKSFYDYPRLTFMSDEIFNHCTGEIAEYIVDTMEKTEIESVSEFDTLLKEATILELANSKDGAGALKKALEEYAKEFGITKTITTKMCEAIIKASDFSDFEAVKKKIENYDDNDGSSNRGGGGSGGGGSGSSKVTLNNLSNIIPTTDNKEDIKPSEVAPFDDIENVSWAHEAIGRLYKDKVINGKTENMFFPMDNVTRAEFVKILMLAFDVKLVDKEIPFTDVGMDEWSYEYVRSAYLAGVVNGIDDKTFGKDQNITRQDLAVMVYRLLTTGKPELKASDAALTFADKEKLAEYAKEAVGFMQANGIINGDENKNFNPGSPATRAEAAKIVYNAAILYEKS